MAQYIYDDVVVTGKRNVRSVTLTDSATITINSNTTDIGVLTSLSQDSLFAAPTGTPEDNQLLQYRITSSVSRTLTYNAIFSASSSRVLPTNTTGGGKEDYIVFRYNAATSKWVLIASTIEVSIQTTLNTISSTQGSILYRNASSWVALSPGTAGQVLQSGGAGADPSWITSEWITITKGSDESRTSNTTTSVDGALTFTPPSTGFYQFELFLIITCTATTGGLRGGFTIPTNAQLNWNARNSGNSGLTNGSNSQISSGIIAAANSATTQMVYMNCAAQHTDASGAFTLTWAQNTSSANSTTIKAGSILRWKKVA